MSGTADPPGPFPRGVRDATDAAAWFRQIAFTLQVALALPVRPAPVAMINTFRPLIPPGAQAALRKLAARWPARAQTPASVARPPDLDPRPAPMRPLHPPSATNDNPLQAVHDAVERDLRARGHLG